VRHLLPDFIEALAALEASKVELDSQIKATNPDKKEEGEDAEVSEDDDAVDEAQLKTWKKELGALKKQLKIRKAAFAEYLSAAVDALDEPQAATLLLAVLRHDMQVILNRYISARRQRIVAAFENWWDKYRVTLTEIEQERDAAAGELQRFLTALGYV
jgi:type I restriction enzyme M protein